MSEFKSDLDSEKFISKTSLKNISEIIEKEASRLSGNLYLEYSKTCYKFTQMDISFDKMNMENKIEAAYIDGKVKNTLQEFLLYINTPFTPLNELEKKHIAEKNKGNYLIIIPGAGDNFHEIERTLNALKYLNLEENSKTHESHVGKPGTELRDHKSISTNSDKIVGHLLKNMTTLMKSQKVLLKELSDIIYFIEGIKEFNINSRVNRLREHLIPMLLIYKSFKQFVKTSPCGNNFKNTNSLPQKFNYQHTQMDNESSKVLKNVYGKNTIVVGLPCIVESDINKESDEGIIYPEMKASEITMTTVGCQKGEAPGRNQDKMSSKNYENIFANNDENVNFADCLQLAKLIANSSDLRTLSFSIGKFLSNSVDGSTHLEENLPLISEKVLRYKNSYKRQCRKQLRKLLLLEKALRKLGPSCENLKKFEALSSKNVTEPQPFNDIFASYLLKGKLKILKNKLLNDHNFLVNNYVNYIKNITSENQMKLSIQEVLKECNKKNDFNIKEWTDIMDINKKAFDDLEKTLKMVKIIEKLKREKDKKKKNLRNLSDLSPLIPNAKQGSLLRGQLSNCNSLSKKFLHFQIPISGNLNEIKYNPTISKSLEDDHLLPCSVNINAIRPGTILCHGQKSDIVHKFNKPKIFDDVLNITENIKNDDGKHKACLDNVKTMNSKEIDKNVQTEVETQNKEQNNSTIVQELSFVPNTQQKDSLCCNQPTLLGLAEKSSNEISAENLPLSPAEILMKLYQQDTECHNMVTSNDSQTDVDNFSKFTKPLAKKSFSETDIKHSVEFFSLEQEDIQVKNDKRFTSIHGNELKISNKSTASTENFNAGRDDYLRLKHFNKLDIKKITENYKLRQDENYKIKKCTDDANYENFGIDVDQIDTRELKLNDIRLFTACENDFKGVCHAIETHSEYPLYDSPKRIKKTLDEMIPFPSEIQPSNGKMMKMSTTTTSKYRIKRKFMYSERLAPKMDIPSVNQNKFGRLENNYVMNYPLKEKVPKIRTTDKMTQITKHVKDNSQSVNLPLPIKKHNELPSKLKKRNEGNEMPVIKDLEKKKFGEKQRTYVELKMPTSNASKKNTSNGNKGILRNVNLKEHVSKFGKPKENKNEKFVPSNSNQSRSRITSQLKKCQVKKTHSREVPTTKKHLSSNLEKSSSSVENIKNNCQLSVCGQIHPCRTATDLKLSSNSLSYDFCPIIYSPPKTEIITVDWEEEHQADIKYLFEQELTPMKMVENRSLNSLIKTENKVGAGLSENIEASPSQSTSSALQMSSNLSSFPDLPRVAAEKKNVEKKSSSTKTEIVERISAMNAKRELVETSTKSETRTAICGKRTPGGKNVINQAPASLKKVISQVLPQQTIWSSYLRPTFVRPLKKKKPEFANKSYKYETKEIVVGKQLTKVTYLVED